MKLMLPFLLVAGIGLVGCVSTQEMPLAPNVVRLDTHASGRLFVGQATSQTMRKAAEATLQRGYTHFTFEDASLAQGQQFAGVATSSTVNSTGQLYGVRNGSGFSGSYNGSAYGSAFSTPMYRPTTDVGVTVVMFHANEPGAKGAFDAAEALRQSGS